MKTRLNWMLWLIMLSMVAGLSACGSDNDDPAPDSNDGLQGTTWSRTLSTEDFQGLIDSDATMPPGTTGTIRVKFVSPTLSKVEINIKLKMGEATMGGLVKCDIPYIYSGQTKKITLKLSQASNFEMVPQMPGVNVGDHLMKEDIDGIVNWDSGTMTFIKDDHVVLILNKA